MPRSVRLIVLRLYPCDLACLLSECLRQCHAELRDHALGRSEAAGMTRILQADMTSIRLFRALAEVAILGNPRGRAVTQGPVAKGMPLHLASGFQPINPPYLPGLTAASPPPCDGASGYGAEDVFLRS